MLRAINAGITGTTGSELGMRFMKIGKCFVPALLLGGLLAPQVGALAQEPDDNVAQLRRCALIDDESQRHRCYDSVLRPGSSGAPATAPTTGPAAATEPPVVATPAIPAAVPPVAVPPVAVPSTKVNDAVQAGRQRFGVRDIRPEEPDFIDIVIISIGKTKLGKLIYHTQDGQVWLQSDTRRPPAYRKTPFAARINKGSMGSFFIKPDRGGYSVRVQRRN